MSEIDMAETPQDSGIAKWMGQSWQVKVLGVTGAVMGTVGSASAAGFDLSNITALVTSFVSMLPTFLDLVIGIAPIIIAVTVIGFVVKFIDEILAMIRIR